MNKSSTKIVEGKKLYNVVIDFRLSKQYINRMYIYKSKLKGNIIYEIGFNGTSEHYLLNSKNYDSKYDFYVEVASKLLELLPHSNEYITGVF